MLIAAWDSEYYDKKKNKKGLAFTIFCAIGLLLQRLIRLHVFRQELIPPSEMKKIEKYS